MDAPDRYSDVLRAVGLDPLTLFPIGITVCVDEESQRVISVVASGEFDVDGRTVSYQETSDALTKLVIQTIPAQVPAPLPSPGPVGIHTPVRNQQ